jgi:hypothetical protein
MTQRDKALRVMQCCSRNVQLWNKTPCRLVHYPEDEGGKILRILYTNLHGVILARFSEPQTSLLVTVKCLNLCQLQPRHGASFGSENV